jgi:transcriptional regulator with XRE-family HTH domain
MTTKRRFGNPTRKIGRNLRRERLRLGLTQAAAAAQSGVSPGTIRAIEQGRRPYVLLTTLAQIAGALGIPLRKLFEGC